MAIDFDVSNIKQNILMIADYYHQDAGYEMEKLLYFFSFRSAVFFC